METKKENRGQMWIKNDQFCFCLTYLSNSCLGAGLNKKGKYSNSRAII